MRDWRDDPELSEFAAESLADPEIASVMEDAVAAYKRWLTSEIEKMWQDDHAPKGATWHRVGYVKMYERVLALIEQEDAHDPLV